MSESLIRPDLSDDQVVIEISLHAGAFMALLFMGRQRGLPVERLAELTHLAPDTLTAVLADWPVDAVLAARP